MMPANGDTGEKYQRQRLTFLALQWQLWRCATLVLGLAAYSLVALADVAAGIFDCI